MHVLVFLYGSTACYFIYMYLSRGLRGVVVRAALLESDDPYVAGSNLTVPWHVAAGLSDETV
jgi:hypothetical protein